MKEKKYCLKCGKELSGKQTKFCCKECRKIYRQRVYRQEHKDQCNEYKRMYRKLGKRHLTSTRRKKMVEKLGGKCFRCQTIENLDLHHIKPLRCGGENTENNLMLLCKSCHRKWHKEFDNDFWKIE